MIVNEKLYNSRVLNKFLSDNKQFKNRNKPLYLVDSNSNFKNNVQKLHGKFLESRE